MISRNDSALGLFNGDIGIALKEAMACASGFPMPDGSIKSGTAKSSAGARYRLGDDGA